MNTGKNIYLKELFQKYIYIQPFPEKNIVENAPRKFTVLKARSGRIVKANVHNLVVNKRKKK